MGSMKNTGQVRSGQTTMGSLTSEDSVCNFIAPSVQVLRQEIKRTEINCSKPGIIHDMIDLADKEKSHKICIDGKRINSGFGKALGDVDLYNHEDSPTLQEQKERLTEEQTLFDDATSLLEKANSFGHVRADQDIVKEELLFDIAKVTTGRLKELQFLKTKKELSIEGLKKSQQKWKAANFAFAVSQAQTAVIRIKEKKTVHTYIKSS